VSQVPFESSVSVEALVHLKDLKHLEEFHFLFWDEVNSYSESDEKNRATELFYSWCGQNLPRLKLIGGTFEDCLGTYGDWRVQRPLVDRISPKFSGVSDLETLHAAGNLPQAKLPNLKKLFYSGFGIHRAPNLLSTLSSFQNLTHLGVHYIEWRHLVLILELVGKRLSHLFYELLMYPENFDLYQVFHLCPNLVYYEQSMCPDAALALDSPFKSLLSKHNFRNLRVFLTLDVPPEVFKMVCEAPMIESIWCSFKFSVEHCEALESVESFRNLEQLQLINLKGFADGCTLEDFERMVKKVVCSAPKLKDIQVTWMDSFQRPLGWENSSAIKFMQLI